MSADVVVEEVGEADAELAAAFARLVPQLSSSSPPPDVQALARIVESPATTLFVARHAGRVVGSLTLVLFAIPTGMRAIIEDVVVDGEARGKGVGEALTRAALQRAAAGGCKTVDLTSRPSREAANRLYQRMGFQRRETNVYRFDLPG